MKGIGSLLSFVILVGITLSAIAIVLTSSQSTSENAIKSVDLRDAETILMLLDNRIREVASEGNGSARSVSFNTPGTFEVIGSDNAIEFEIQTSVFEYFSRFMRGNLVYINGNDVSCGRKDANGDGKPDLVLENTFSIVAFEYINKTTPYQVIDTGNNLIQFYSRPLSSMLEFSNSSILIDGASSGGVGFSEILREGTNLPSCTVHVYVDSADDYEVFYTLYAGADFITSNVKIK